MRRVVVTGLGAAAPHGLTATSVIDGLLEGHCAIARQTAGTPPHETLVTASVCELGDAAASLGKARLMTMDRCAQLAAVAGLGAWRDAGLETLQDAAREDVPVLWGTGAGGAQTHERGYRDVFVKGRPRVSPMTVMMGMHNAPAAHLSMLLRLGGPCTTISVACASSAEAIGRALQAVRSGSCDVALAGGSEAAMPFGAVKAWQSLQVLAGDGAGTDPAQACRPFDARRAGLVPGEGAAALVLEALEHAIARGAPILGEVLGWGASCDHTHLTSPDTAGQVRAWMRALRDARVGTDAVGYVNAHGTGTLDGDPVEVTAIRHVFGEQAGRLAVSSTKSMHGHLMGAAGALEALVTLMALRRRALPPTRTLNDIDPACAGVDHVRGAARHGVDVRVAASSSFAFGGSNVVLLFGRWDG